MTGIKSILRMDMATLLYWLRRGWSWWADELRSAMPFLSGRGAPKSRLVAEFSDGKLVFREYRTGANLPIPRIGPAPALLPKASLALPASEVLLQEISMPPMPLSDLRRAIAIDIDRLTPLPPGEAVFDLEVTRPAPDSPLRTVYLGVVRRSALQQVLEDLAAWGGTPAGICMLDRHAGRPRFDFLAGLRFAEGLPSSGGGRGYWWAAVAVLFLINISVLALRDMAGVDALSAEVEAQQPRVAYATALRRKVEAESRLRETLLKLRAEHEPLVLLDAVTHALPDGVYVQHFEWDGEKLHLLGTSAAGIDVSERLRGVPSQLSVKKTDRAELSNIQRFDVAITPKGMGRP